MRQFVVVFLVEVGVQLMVDNFIDVYLLATVGALDPVFRTHMDILRKNGEKR